MDLKQKIETQTRMINGYIAYLKRSKHGENEPGAYANIREPETDYLIETPEIH